MNDKDNNTYGEEIRPFISEIAMFAFDFAPKGWATCDGQLLQVQQNQALFSLLRTTYGGHANETFALPNLQGRVAVGAETMDPQDTEKYYRGQKGGVANVQLTVDNLPGHTHDFLATKEEANKVKNKGGYKLASFSGNDVYTDPQTSEKIERIGLYDSSHHVDHSHIESLYPSTVDSSGMGLPHSNIQPCVSVLFCIAIEGEWPSRG